MISKLFAAFDTNKHPQCAAIAYILVSTTAFSAMNVAVRMLADHLHPTLTVALRTLLTLALLVPWLVYYGREVMATSRIHVHLVRGVVGGFGMIGWVYSVSILPVSYATALSFTAPLFVTLLAMLFLGEHSSWQRFFALLIGFIGTLIILRPASHAFDWRSLVVLGTTILWAITGILVKSLSASEPPLRMVFYMNLIMLLVSLPFAIHHWLMPTPAQWAILLVIAVCSLIMHLTMVRAYALAPLVTLMPFDFTRLITTALFAYLLFGETIDIWTWIGAAIIIASAVFTARRDTKAAMMD